MEAVAQEPYQPGGAAKHNLNENADQKKSWIKDRKWSMPRVNGMAHTQENIINFYCVSNIEVIRSKFAVITLS
jgi:hypothetical protein